jgi:hypothetical protein
LRVRTTSVETFASIPCSGAALVLTGSAIARDVNGRAS